MVTADTKLAAVAGQQAGAFTRRQAVAAGFSVKRVKHRCESGEWVMLHPGVLCVSTARRSRETRAVAGLLYCGESARFSHVTAARLLGFDVISQDHRIWLTIPHTRRARQRPGLVITRTRHMPRAVNTFGQPVTPPARTIVDLAQVLDRDQLTGVLYDALRRKIATIEGVLAAAERLGARQGLRLLHSVVDEFDPSFESVLEAEAAGHFVAAGIELEPQVEVRDEWWLIARVDFADLKRKLAVEIDGARPHERHAARKRDAQRDRRLHRLGWTVLRFTTADVRRRPHDMVREVRDWMQALDARQAGA